MAINKVVFGNNTLIDLTNDTVDANSLLQGSTAHDRSGNQIQGAVVVAPIDDTTTASNKVWSSQKVNSVTGELSNLHTTDKTSLVNAINEVKENSIAPHLIISSESGSTVTVSNGTITLTPTETGSTGIWECNVPKFDTWTITSVKGNITATITINVDIAKVYEVSLELKPEGSTVLPTDDIQTWLKCGGIFDKAYTTLGEVLADTTTLSALINDNNASDYLVRSKSWTTANGLVPIMTSNTTPSGEVIYGSNLSGGGRQPYYVFDGNMNGTDWNSEQNTLDESKVFIGYKFVNPTIVKRIGICVAKETTYTDWFSSGTFKVLASNDNSVWDTLESSLTWEYPNNQMQYFNIDNDNAYLYYKVVFLSYMYGNGTSTKGCVTAELQFYATTELQGICDNSTAMAYIGANDYCADKLLSDNTWLTAICNSAYVESVLDVKVPTMTSNTTPSGVASASSAYSQYGQEAWKAFDGNNTTSWNTTDNQGLNAWLKYDFGTAKVVKAVKIHPYWYEPVSALYLKDYKIQGSNDNFVNDINDLYTGNLSNANVGGIVVSFENSTAYRYYRLLATSASYHPNGNVGLFTLQFYGRASS